MIETTTTTGQDPALPLAQSPPASAPSRPTKRWRPNFDKKAPKVWDPEKAKAMPRYPQSEAKYQEMRERNRATLAQTRATGRLTRVGVPTGYSGQKAQLSAVAAKAADEGKRVIAAARDVGILDVAEDDARAAEALEVVAGFLRNPLVHTQHRMASARLLLDFLMLRPAARGAATTTAEAVLAAITTVAGLSPIASHVTTTAIGGTALPRTSQSPPPES